MKKSTIIFWSSILLSSQILYNSTIPGKISMYGETIYTNGVVYDKVWNAYAKVPDKVKLMLQDNKYRIYIVDIIDNNANILGQTTYAVKLIKIRDLNCDVETTLMHECGHVLDDESHILFISWTKEFKDIFAEEKDAFYYVVDDNYEYYITNEKEYFAQAFAEFILNPEKLNFYTPKTYKFIEECLK